MPDRKIHFSTPWLWTALALMAWVVLAAARSEGADSVPGRTDAHAAAVVIAPVSPALFLGAAVPVEDLPQVNALFPEGEEQDQVGAPAADLLPYQVPRSFGQVADRRPTAPRATPSPYPLRC